LPRIPEPRKRPTVGQIEDGPLEKAFRKHVSEDDAKFLVKFYNNFFNKNPNGKNFSTKEKIGHLEYLITTYGKDKVLACLKSVYHDWNIKFLPSVRNPVYIEKVISNFDMNKQIKETPTSVKPKKYKRIDRGQSNEDYNWDYQCACGAIIGPWTLTCPNCDANINWEDSE